MDFFVRAGGDDVSFETVQLLDLLVFRVQWHGVHVTPASLRIQNE